MKFSTIINAFFLTLAARSTPTTNAFLANNGIQGQWKQHPVASTRVDTADMIEEALNVCKEYGATSPEARVAWEAVGEIYVSDNSASTLGMRPDDQAQVQGLVTKYLDQIATLDKMIAEVEAVKLSAAPTRATPAKKDSAKLKEAEEKPSG